MTDIMNTPGADGGDAFVSACTAVGADYIFCSSGSEWAPVWESLARRHRDGIACPHYLDLTHETVAVGMATGYGLVKRRPQAVLLHAAPGLLQGSMAVHGALLAGVPMVVSSSESTTYGDGAGQDPGGQWYRNLSIVGGPHTVAQPFTKWSNEAASVHTLPTMITRAAELARRAPAKPRLPQHPAGSAAGGVGRARGQARRPAGLDAQLAGGDRSGRADDPRGGQPGDRHRDRGP